MKSVDQLACAAFTAYMQHRIKPVAGYQPTDWNDLDAPTREAWIAAVQAVRTEIAAVH